MVSFMVTCFNIEAKNAIPISRHLLLLKGRRLEVSSPERMNQRDDWTQEHDAAQRNLTKNTVGPAVHTEQQTTIPRQMHFKIPTAGVPREIAGPNSEGHLHKFCPQSSFQSMPKGPFLSEQWRITRHLKKASSREDQTKQELKERGRRQGQLEEGY